MDILSDDFYASQRYRNSKGDHYGRVHIFRKSFKQLQYHRFHKSIFFLYKIMYTYVCGCVCTYYVTDDDSINIHNIVQRSNICIWFQNPFPRTNFGIIFKFHIKCKKKQEFRQKCILNTLYQTGPHPIKKEYCSFQKLF